MSVIPKDRTVNPKDSQPFANLGRLTADIAYIASSRRWVLVLLPFEHMIDEWAASVLNEFRKMSIPVSKESLHPRIITPAWGGGVRFALPTEPLQYRGMSMDWVFVIGPTDQNLLEDVNSLIAGNRGALTLVPY